MGVGDLARAAIGQQTCREPAQTSSVWDFSNASGEATRSPLRPCGTRLAERELQASPALGRASRERGDRLPEPKWPLRVRDRVARCLCCHRVCSSSLDRAAVARRDDEPLRLVCDGLADERRYPGRQPNRLALGVVQPVSVPVRCGFRGLSRQPSTSRTCRVRNSDSCSRSIGTSWFLLSYQSELTPRRCERRLSASPQVPLCLGYSASSSRPVSRAQRTTLSSARHRSGRAAQRAAGSRNGSRELRPPPGRQLPRQATPLWLSGLGAGQLSERRPRCVLPVGTHAGVSSYQNAGVPKATLQIRYRNGGGSDQPSLPRNSSGNLARAYNDLATKLYVIC